MVDKNLFKILFVCCLISKSSFAFANSKSIDEEVQEAISTYNEDHAAAHLHKSIKHLNSLIAKDPSDSNALLKRAECFYTLDEKYKGLADCNHVLAINPNSAKAYLLRAWLYSVMPDQDNKKAEWNYSRAVQIQPDNLELVQERAFFYFGEAKYALAIDDYSSVIEVKPSAGLYCYRARAYAANNQLEDALVDANKAIELDPDYGFGYLERAGVYRLMHKDKQAAKDYSIASKLGAGEPN